MTRSVDARWTSSSRTIWSGWKPPKGTPEWRRHRRKQTLRQRNSALLKHVRNATRLETSTPTLAVPTRRDFCDQDNPPPTCTNGEVLSRTTCNKQTGVAFISLSAVSSPHWCYHPLCTVESSWLRSDWSALEWPSRSTAQASDSSKGRL